MTSPENTITAYMGRNRAVADSFKKTKIKPLPQDTKQASERERRPIRTACPSAIMEGRDSPTATCGHVTSACLCCCFIAASEATGHAVSAAPPSGELMTDKYKYFPNSPLSKQ
ncbi:hypothetical protein ILYODFUR_020668 [Ilyodon furcidens]|uniref:Uncharacterized protein n=1 Tax=Ilyodon furcidens TaxID=33524 RepID=A0ABV0TY26_9TELE